MYAKHVPIIEYAMRQDVDTFCKGVMFAVLSARVQFARVPEQCRELAENGQEARCLWSWKYDAYKYLEQHKATIWRAVCACPKTKIGANHAIANLCRIPGLGIVKAAFIAQMLGHNVACLDIRNIQRDGRNPRAYRSDGEARKVMPAFTAKIARYVDETWGTAEHYWNTWCNEVGPDYGMTGEACSMEHVTAIVPKRLIPRDEPAHDPAMEVPF